MMIEDYINQYLGDYHNSWAGNPVLNHPVFQGTTQGFEQCSDLFHGFRSCYNVEPIRSMLVLNQCESLGSVWAIHLSQVNQIGSISEAIEACKMCQDRGWGVTWHHSREHTQRSQQYFVFFWNTFGIFNIYINVFHRGLKTVLSAPSLVGFRVFSSWNWRWIDLQSILVAGWWLWLNMLKTFSIFDIPSSHTFRVEGARIGGQPSNSGANPKSEDFHVRPGQMVGSCVGMWTHFWNQRPNHVGFSVAPGFVGYLPINTSDVPLPCLIASGQ
jgi:hypothetical protein